MKSHLHCKGCEYLEYLGIHHYLEGFRCTYHMTHPKDGLLRRPEYIESVKKCPKRLEEAEGE